MENSNFTKKKESEVIKLANKLKRPKLKENKWRDLEPIGAGQLFREPFAW